MRVRVLLFGLLKDRAGRAEHELELPAGSTAGDVLPWLAGLVADDALLRSLACAVNREYAGPGTPLSDGDEVALLPPVSGGA